jgi:caffeoyl-CoA O-methyltransferase
MAHFKEGYLIRGLSLQKSLQMEIVPTKAQAYAAEFSSPENDLLHSIAKTTRDQHRESHMLSGHVQGKFLEMISMLMRPARILEIGTFVGYSALCLARGLCEEGKLYTIEVSQKDAEISQSNFLKAKMADKIILHRGNALDIIPTLSEIWDLVFIDADKTNYMNYYRMILPFVRRGGLIIADNVLFHGEVLADEIKGKNAKSIHAFNEMIKADLSVEKAMLTVRDGLFLIYKN